MLNFMTRSPLRDPDPAPGSSGDPAKPPVFDPAAFQTTLLAEIDKRINGLDKRYQKEFTALKTPKPSPVADPVPDPDPDPGSHGGDKPDPKTVQLEYQATKLRKELEDIRKSFDEEKKAREGDIAARRAAERDSKVQGVLGGLGPFADETAAKDAFALVRDKVYWSEDFSELLGGEGIPFEAYLKDFVGARKNLLAPRDVGGAGARGGNGRPNRRTWTMENLDPQEYNKLSPEDKKDLGAHIAEMTARTQMGQ